MSYESFRAKRNAEYEKNADTPGFGPCNFPLKEGRCPYFPENYMDFVEHRYSEHDIMPGEGDIYDG